MRAVIFKSIPRTIVPVIALGTVILLVAPGRAAPQSGKDQFKPEATRASSPTAPETRQAGQRGQRSGRPGNRAYKLRVAPHWFHDNSRFWYLNDLPDGAKEFILVQVEKGIRQPAFDHEKLAASLSKASGTEVQARKLPFNSIDFGPDDTSIHFDMSGVRWQCDLTSYACVKISGDNRPLSANPAQSDRDSDAQAGDQSGDPQIPDPEEISPYADPLPQPPARGQRGGRAEITTPRSPDGKWTALIKENNVYIRSADGTEETGLSKDGKPGQAYGMLQWAPDSRSLVAWRIEVASPAEVFLVESSPRGGGRARLHTRPYALPGDKFPGYELSLFNIADKKQTKPELERVDFGRPRLRWSRDGNHFTYEKVDRGHQRFRVVEVDVQTGQSRNLIDERTQTFIWTAHTETLRLSLVNYLQKSDEIIYVSERDGWRHLYLIDVKKGIVKNQITRGEYVVRGIDRIDEEKRQIWFQASGKNQAQDPYFIHFYRINFDGSGLIALTEGNGDHSIQFSPDRKYLIDTYSRVDKAPVHELRRVEDGKLVCNLEEADIAELQRSGWTPPEVFVAKGRDGTTDIWGIICRPRAFDAKKKYPVIEQIYAGPQGSFTPKSFSPARRFASLTDLGFVVVQMDGMGTANRSKAFHDVCWKNLKDAGFPDRILWHQAVAKKYPWYDITRVGITGGSAGGQNSTGGLLFHPEFYKVAVSGCGCHDNRMDKASWNEQWMGYPVGPQYAECSNIDNAHKLRGKLLLIVGEMDTNVPPESTYRLVDSLIRAGKDFDYLAVPGANHGMGGAYGARRLQDFFVRHLLGVEPPGRNE